MSALRGTEDMRRQSMNVRRMKLLGAEVVEVKSGSKTLKDATTEAIRDWVTNVRTTHYIIGSVVGPHPYPEMVRDLQRVIGDEAREQYLSLDGKLPDVVVACVGGGSNAIGIFTAFLDDRDVALVGVEAAGRGVKTGEHAASLVGGRPGVLHGTYSYVLQDGDGQILPTHSISAGLDYPGLGPEHAFLPETARGEGVGRSGRRGPRHGQSAFRPARRRLRGPACGPGRPCAGHGGFGRARRGPGRRRRRRARGVDDVYQSRALLRSAAVRGRGVAG